MVTVDKLLEKARNFNALLVNWNAAIDPALRVNEAHTRSGNRPLRRYEPPITPLRVTLPEDGAGAAGGSVSRSGSNTGAEGSELYRRESVESGGRRSQESGERPPLEMQMAELGRATTLALDQSRRALEILERMEREKEPSQPQPTFQTPPPVTGSQAGAQIRRSRSDRPYYGPAWGSSRQPPVPEHVYPPGRDLPTPSRELPPISQGGRETRRAGFKEGGSPTSPRRPCTR